MNVPPLPQAQPVKKAPPIIEIIEDMPMSSKIGLGVAVGFFLFAVVIVVVT